MNISLKTKKQIKYIIIPIIWHIIYLLINGSFEKTHRIYFEFIFYMGLIIYFTAIGTISLKSLLKEWKKGKNFWLPVLITTIGLGIAFGIGMFISVLLPNIDDGMSAFSIVDLPSLLAFAITTIFLPSIAEEAFYRKGMIIFDNKILLIFSFILSTLLFASEHSTKPLGILIAVIWAIPLTISYLKTKNVYIPMTAHFICNFIMNGISVVMIGIRLIGI